MDHPEPDDELDIEGELAAARAMILSGEYSHGVRHLGFAASIDPGHPDVEDLLGVVLDDVGELAPDTVEPARPDGLWSGEAAVRAWFLHGLGRDDEAVDLLLQVVSGDPERRWSLWLVQWLADDPDLPVPSGSVSAACGALIEPVLHAEPSEAYAATLADVTVVVERAIAGDPSDGPLRTIGSGLARRVGRVDDAVRWAVEGDSLEPTMISGCMLGYAHRASGDEQQAFTAFEKASERAPSDPSPRLDAADSLANLAEWDRAAEWATAAWRLDPELGTAAARTLYSRWRATGDAAHALELLAWLEERTAEDGTGPETLRDAPEIAGALAAELPWTCHLPVPANAAVNIAAQLVAAAPAEHTRGPMKLTVSLPEAPSALLALAHTCGKRLMVTTSEVPEPDPRLPRGPVRTLTWRLDGSDLAPAVPPPTPRALGAVRLTPTPWYRMETAERDGADLAAAGATINDLVTLALHAQPGPRTVTPWDWVRRWEVVCCIALAERDALDVLCDFADGPEDWICDAALAGLLHLAQRRPDLQARILKFATDHLIESIDRLKTLDLAHFGSECDLYVLLPGRLDVDAEAAQDMKRTWMASQQERTSVG